MVEGALIISTWQNRGGVLFKAGALIMKNTVNGESESQDELLALEAVCHAYTV